MAGHVTEKQALPGILALLVVPTFLRQIFHRDYSGQSAPVLLLLLLQRPNIDRKMGTTNV